MRWCDGDVDLRDEVLSTLNDLVYLRWRSERSDEVGSFLRSDEATVGLFRDESAFLSFHTAWRTLAGNASVDVPDSRTPFTFGCNLSGFEGRHDTSFVFTSPDPLPDRCHALIGRNGSGKTRFLRELVIKEGIKRCGSNPFLEGGASTSTSVESPPDSQGPQFNRLVVMTWDLSSTLPAFARLDAPLEYLFFQMTGDTVMSDRVSAESDTLTFMLSRLLRDRGSEDRPDLYVRLRRILRPIFDIERLAVMLRPIDGVSGAGEWFTLAALHGAGEQQKLERIGRIEPGQAPTLLSTDQQAIQLSSGERAFLNFAIRIVASVRDGSLVLLDEPETHLHPTLISDFMRVLQPLLIETRSIAIVATHSPYVVRELPSSCVHIVTVDEDRVPSVRSAYLRTLGANVDRLSIDIFEDAADSKYYIKLAGKIASQNESFDDVILHYGSELSSEMLSLVREAMEDRDEASRVPDA